MFPNLATWETCCGNKKIFLPEVKNIFASRTQMLLSKHIFPSLVTTNTELTWYQCCCGKQTIMAAGEVEVEEKEKK